MMRTFKIEYIYITLDKYLLRNISAVSRALCEPEYRFGHPEIEPKRLSSTCFKNFVLNERVNKHISFL